MRTTEGTIYVVLTHTLHRRRRARQPRLRRGEPVRRERLKSMGSDAHDELRLKRRMHREPAMSSQHRPKPEDIEILIVEDSPTQAEQLRRLVEAHGYRARVAGNGKTAIEAMSERTPDLVLSDIEMPEMDGYALCYAIKSDERWSELASRSTSPASTISVIASRNCSTAARPKSIWTGW